MLFHALQQLELRFGANQVVLRILDFVVGIPVDVVGQEAHALHVGEESSCVGQILYLDRQQEALGRFQIALSEGLEDFHVERYVAQFGVILQSRIGS